MDMVSDPLLAPHFQWDSRQLYKWNGTRYSRFIHDPFTADRYWNVQVSLVLILKAVF